MGHKMPTPPKGQNIGIVISIHLYCNYELLQMSVPEKLLFLHFYLKSARHYFKHSFYFHKKTWFESTQLNSTHHFILLFNCYFTWKVFSNESLQNCSLIFPMVGSLTISCILILQKQKISIKYTTEVQWQNSDLFLSWGPKYFLP